LAIAQSYGMIVLLNSLAGGTILDTSNTQVVLMAMAIIVTGTMFLMWL
jgi:preprotein translocase subunit SecY